MSIYTGLTSEYTQALKDITMMGQKQSLWDQFLTGVNTTYQPLYTQAAGKAAYDISGAYANYKQQQLQLMMNNQLGAGFKEQLAADMKSQYQTEYDTIKAEEAETLYDIALNEKAAIQKGEDDFTALGKQIRAYDELLMEYAGLLEGEQYIKPSDFRDLETGELTDAAKLWYYDVREGTATDYESFDAWMKSENGSEKYSVEEREKLLEQYKQNPEIFERAATGLTDEFDIESARKAQNERFYNTPIKSKVELSGKLSSANSGDGDNFEIKYNGKTYKVEKGYSPEGVQGTLTKEYKDRYGVDEIDEGTIVQYKDKLYMYIENNDTNRKEWTYIRGRYFDRDDYNELAEELGLMIHKDTYYM